MSVWSDDVAIHLEGDCHVEAAETLVALIQAHPGRPVDLSQCRHLHSAVIQALLVLAPPRRGGCADSFLEAWILSSLPREGNVTASRQA